MKSTLRKNKSVAYGQWLRNILDEHKIRVIDLSNKSGIHSNVIQNWLRGHCLPNGYSCVLVATALSQLLEESRAEILDSMADSLLKS